MKEENGGERGAQPLNMVGKSTSPLQTPPIFGCTVLRYMAHRMSQVAITALEDEYEQKGPLDCTHISHTAARKHIPLCAICRFSKSMSYVA
jgi:hypothetical protein